MRTPFAVPQPLREHTDNRAPQMLCLCTLKSGHQYSGHSMGVCIGEFLSCTTPLEIIIHFSSFRPPPMDGVNSRSHEAIHQHPSHSPPHSSHGHNGTGSDVNVPLSSSYPRSCGIMASSIHGGSSSGQSAASSQFHSNMVPSPIHITGSHSGITSPSHTQYSGSHSRAPPASGRTPPVRRANYERSDGHTPRHGNSHSELSL